MLTKTDEYALRAVLWLAQQDTDRPTPANAIADALALPRNYLSKTLNRLAKRGVLASERGPHGGFRLARPPHAVRVVEIVADMNGLWASQVCSDGNARCRPDHLCAIHTWWQNVARAFTRMMEKTTLDALMNGKRGLNGRSAS